MEGIKYDNYFQLIFNAPIELSSELTLLTLADSQTIYTDVFLLLSGSGITSREAGDSITAVI